MTETVEITCIRCPIGCDIELEVDDGIRARCDPF